MSHQNIHMILRSIDIFHSLIFIKPSEGNMHARTGRNRRIQDTEQKPLQDQRSWSTTKKPPYNVEKKIAQAQLFTRWAQFKTLGNKIPFWITGGSQI